MRTGHYGPGARRKKEYRGPNVLRFFLRRRILFTFGLLVVYRIGARIPTPGIDLAALAPYRWDE